MKLLKEEITVRILRVHIKRYLAELIYHLGSSRKGISHLRWVVSGHNEGRLSRNDGPLDRGKGGEMEDVSGGYWFQGFIW